MLKQTTRVFKTLIILTDVVKYFGARKELFSAEFCCGLSQKLPGQSNSNLGSLK